MNRDLSSDDALLRYSRQILLPEVGAEGQERLQRAHALIIGLGGLGSPAAMYLAAAGVGTLSLNDFDTVDLSNLQRQVVHSTADIGRTKVDSAAATLHALNPDCTLHTLNGQLDSNALAAAIARADIVLDCSDNFVTRFAVNAACVALRKPLVAGAAIRMEGQLMVFRADLNPAPCYQCLFPEGAETEQTCSRNGVLAPIVGVIGSLQVVEALKILLGLGNSNASLQIYDGRHNQWRSLNLQADPSCSCCRNHA